MNRKIIVAVFVIGASGIVNAVTNKTKVTPVILGAYIFLLVLALLDTFGGQLSVLSGALAMLAMTFVLLTEFPWNIILGIVKEKPLPTNTGQAPTESRGPGQT